MNGNVRKIFDEISLPDRLHEAVEAGIDEKRSVKMDKKISKKFVIVLAAVICIALLCAAGWPALRGSIWGESAVLEKNSEGEAVAIMQSIFDPAVYGKNINNKVYCPTAVFGDPEAEIMTVFDELETLESSPFKFYEENGEEIENIGDYRIEIGESVKAVCEWSEFTLTRENENKFNMLDSNGYGFAYYIYPLTGDTHIDLDFTPVGLISNPDGDVKTVENGAGGFTLKPGETAAVGEDVIECKKGDRIRFTVKFKNVSDEEIGDNVYLGYYLDPKDPKGESDGIAYREGDGWFYPLAAALDGYETVMEYPLNLSGKYRFSIANLYRDSDLEAESFTAEVIPQE